MASSSRCCHARATASERGTQATYQGQCPDDRGRANDRRDGVGIVYGLGYLGLGGEGAEVLEDGGLVEADLTVADQVVGDSVAQSQGIGRPAGRPNRCSQRSQGKHRQRLPSLRNFS